MDLNFKNFLNHLKERDLLEIIIKSRDEAKKQISNLYGFRFYF